MGAELNSARVGGTYVVAEVNTGIGTSVIALRDSDVVDADNKKIAFQEEVPDSI